MKGRMGGRSSDTRHVDSQQFGSSPNYNIAHYTSFCPMSSSDEMPALVSSSEDEEGGEVKPDSESSDSGFEGSTTAQSVMARAAQNQIPDLGPKPMTF